MESTCLIRPLEDDTLNVVLDEVVNLFAVAFPDPFLLHLDF